MNEYLKGTLQKTLDGIFSFSYLRVWEAKLTESETKQYSIKEFADLS